MKIEVLGTGCAKCRKLEANVRQAVSQPGICAEVEKVTDLAAITSYGVMMTPALAVDGEVKTVGRVPNVEEIKALLS